MLNYLCNHLTKLSKFFEHWFGNYRPVAARNEGHCPGGSHRLHLYDIKSDMTHRAVSAIASVATGRLVTEPMVKGDTVFYQTNV